VSGQTEARNAFESGARKVIPAVLVYLRHGDDILMLNRGARPGDFHAGKWNGLGGKLEPGESPREAASREVFEEAGVRLSADRYHLLGMLQFPNFKPKKDEDWLFWVLDATLTLEERGRVLGQSAEGSHPWLASATIPSLNLWPGDRQFLPWVFERRPFCGTFWYEAGEVARSELYHWG